MKILNSLLLLGALVFSSAYKPQLFHAVDNALPSSYIDFDLLLEECRKVHAYSQRTKLSQNKFPTYWLPAPFIQAPKNYVERAVMHLFGYIPTAMANKDRYVIIAHEWFIN